MVVIVAVIGILGAVAAPSFTSLMDGMKVTQAVTDIQTVLQDTQRQAIRTSQPCAVKVPKNNGNGNGHGNGHGKKTITGNCLTSGSPEVSDNVTLASNMQGSPEANTVPNVPALEVADIKFNTLGSAEFSIQSAVQSPLLPTDPTGKVVAFVDNPNVKKKCVAISSTLGLTRLGIYTGDITPTEITDRGVCTALDWKQQQ